MIFNKQNVYLETLFRSIIERFATNEILTNKVKNFNKNDGTQYFENGVDIELKIDAIGEKVIQIIQKINEEQKYISFNILLYRGDLEKLFTFSEKIPLWLRDFILEYKKNLDCYSLDPFYNPLYNIKYTFEPDYNSLICRYYVFPRIIHNSNTNFKSCEKICKYAKQEQKNPNGISEFI